MEMISPENCVVFTLLYFSEARKVVNRWRFFSFAVLHFWQDICNDRLNLATWYNDVFRLEPSLLTERSGITMT